MCMLAKFFRQNGVGYDNDDTQGQVDYVAMWVAMWHGRSWSAATALRGIVCNGHITTTIIVAIVIALCQIKKPKAVRI